MEERCFFGSSRRLLLSLPLLADPLASIIRGLYVAVKQRRGNERVRFISPWLFVLAAILSVITFTGDRLREDDATNRSGVTQGIAQPRKEVTPKQRCITKALEQIRDATPTQRAAIPAGTNVKAFVMRLCANAERRGDLSASGDIFASDSLLMPDCVDSVMLAFGRSRLPNERSRLPISRCSQLRTARRLYVRTCFEPHQAGIRLL